MGCMHAKQKNAGTQTSGVSDIWVSCEAPSKILPWLWLGDLEDYRSRVKLGFTHVVSCVFIVPVPPKSDTHLVCPMADEGSTKLAEVLPSIFEFLDKARETKKPKVLVHCALGVNRSASVVIAYLVKRENLSLHDAMEFVQRQRPIVSPVVEYRRQLRELEVLWNGLTESTLADQEPLSFWSWPNHTPPLIVAQPSSSTGAPATDTQKEATPPHTNVNEPSPGPHPATPPALEVEPVEPTSTQEPATTTAVAGTGQTRASEEEQASSPPPPPASNPEENPTPTPSVGAAPSKD